MVCTTRERCPLLKEKWEGMVSNSKSRRNNYSFVQSQEEEEGVGLDVLLLPLLSADSIATGNEAVEKKW